MKTKTVRVSELKPGMHVHGFGLVSTVGRRKQDVFDVEFNNGTGGRVHVVFDCNTSVSVTDCYPRNDTSHVFNMTLQGGGLDRDDDDMPEDGIEIGDGPALGRLLDRVHDRGDFEVLNLMSRAKVLPRLRQTIAPKVADAVSKLAAIARRLKRSQTAHEAASKHIISEVVKGLKPAEATKSIGEPVQVGTLGSFPVGTLVIIHPREGVWGWRDKVMEITPPLHNDTVSVRNEHSQMAHLPADLMATFEAAPLLSGPMLGPAKQMVTVKRSQYGSDRWVTSDDPRYFAHWVWLYHKGYRQLPKVLTHTLSENTTVSFVPLGPASHYKLALWTGQVFDNSIPIHATIRNVTLGDGGPVRARGEARDRLLEATGFIGPIQQNPRPVSSEPVAPRWWLGEKPVKRERMGRR